MRVIAGIALAVLLAGCIVDIDVDDDDRTIRGSGVVTSVERSLRSFDSVAFATSGQLTIEFGDEESIRIETDDNLLDHIETFVRDGSLHIEVEEGIDIRPHRGIHYRLTVRDLDGVSILGSGEIEFAEVHRENLGIAILGSGNVRIASLMTSSLEIVIAGSGDVHVAGSSSDLEISVSGSGNLMGRDLEVEHASVAILGSGSATLCISDRLEASILGSGSIHYYGSPSVQASILGSGRVVREG